jgi:hypothetical protein
MSLRHWSRKRVERSCGGDLFYLSEARRYPAGRQLNSALNRRRRAECRLDDEKEGHVRAETHENRLEAVQNRSGVLTKLFRLPTGAALFVAALLLFPMGSGERALPAKC